MKSFISMILKELWVTLSGSAVNVAASSPEGGAKILSVTAVSGGDSELCMSHAFRASECSPTGGAKL